MTLDVDYRRVLNSGSALDREPARFSRETNPDVNPGRLRASRRTGIESQSSFYFCETLAERETERQREREGGRRSVPVALARSRTKVNAGATRATRETFARRVSTVYASHATREYPAPLSRIPRASQVWEL